MPFTTSTKEAKVAQIMGLPLGAMPRLETSPVEILKSQFVTKFTGQNTTELASDKFPSSLTITLA